MNITDTTNTPEYLSYLQEAWQKLPSHWQTAMDKAVPAGTEIISSHAIMHKIKKDDVLWVYHPINHPLRAFTSTGLEDLMAFLRKTPKGNQVYCAWRFQVNFFLPHFYFQKHFLRALAIAVYLENEALRQIVAEGTEFEVNSMEAELFFGDTFYKWILYDRSPEGIAEERYGQALACFDRIDAQAKSVL